MSKKIVVLKGNKYYEIGWHKKRVVSFEGKKYRKIEVTFTASSVRVTLEENK